MGVRMEEFPWGRQPREGEQAYAAFLAYRDLGPGRTHEAARKNLGRRPGYLKPIERWSAFWEWCPRAAAWDGHLQSGRDKVAAEEAAKWERRRVQALEEGWQLCRSLRARLEQMLAIPPETPVVTPPEPTGETQEALPGTVAPPEAARATAGRGSTRGNDLAVARLAKLVIELEWAILDQALPPSGEIDPLTATAEEIQVYLARHPRLGRPPPR